MDPPMEEAHTLIAPRPPSTPPYRTPTPEPRLPAHASATSAHDHVMSPNDNRNRNCTPSSDLSSPPVSISRRSRSSCARSSTSLNSSDSARSDSAQTPASTVSSGGDGGGAGDGGCPAFAPTQSKTIVADGVKFDSWPVAARPDAPTLGDEPKRLPDGSVKPRTKREAEDQLEFQWQKKRKLALKEKIFENSGDEAVGCTTKFDMEGSVHFDGEPLPEWLNAEREFQDDGRPGTFIVRPSKEDFEMRWPEILQTLQPFGMRLGIVKLEIPPECLGKVMPYSEWVATRPPEVALPPPPKPKAARKGRPLRGKAHHGRKGLFSKQSSCTPALESEADMPAPEVEGPPPRPPPPDPMVYEMSQHLPLHLNSKHQYAPIYEVISKRKTLVPISSFPHDLDENSQNLRIPEETMLKRGREWADIVKQNPGGEVFYSSDNDVTEELRAYLGLVDPKLDKLPGNHIFDSTETVIGIHTPYLYLGNAYTLFALHQEDYCALSLNFHHKGAPKMWRVTCPLDFDKVERIVARNQDEAPGEKLCSQHVRHASLFLSQGILELEGVRSILVRQKKGEMIITWPLSYHQGWNEGPNICEAIAYGSAVWKKTFVEDGEMMYRTCGRRCITRGMGIPIELDFTKTKTSAAAADEAAKLQADEEVDAKMEVEMKVEVEVEV